MKKIINNPNDVVIEMCNGMVMAHPELEFIKKYKIIKKRNMDNNKVTLISGGGSGHEPAHAGFVGTGALDAAVCGDVFASPSQIQVYKAIKETASEKGTLLIIKNYSGDMMNFKNAAHMAREDGIEVEWIKIDDDIAVNDSLYTVGRRGVAGTIFVHKIAGAAAERNMSLLEVKEIAEKVAQNVKSIGFALTSCTVPAKGNPTFELLEDEMEYGVGIHGEPGIKKEKILTADELANRMVKSLINELKIKDEEIAVMINGFGGTPLQELYLLNNSVIGELDKKNVTIAKTFVGDYMTSLDMAGASVTILKLDEQLKELLFEKCDTPGLKVDGKEEPVIYVDVHKEDKNDRCVSFTVESNEEWANIKDEKISLNNMVYIVDKMSEIIIENEVPFCDLDSHAGDGDFGMSIAKGFRQLKREWHEILDIKNLGIGSFLNACSIIIMEHCGGASGPIWGSAFRAASKKGGDAKELTLEEFADVMWAAVKGIQEVGERSFGRGAEVGDKTLIDALVPFAESLSDSAKKNNSFIKALEDAAKAATLGAKETEKITARMGRAGSVGERSIGYPDAGAHALGVIFTEIAMSMK